MCVKFACWIAILCMTSSLRGQSAPDGKLATAIHADSYVPHLAFNVASIREVRGASMSSINNVPGTSVFFAEDVSLWALIVTAYDIKVGALVQGLPAWAGDVRYNVNAKSDESTDEALSKLSHSDFMAEKHHMLQLLLAERFHLRVHNEQRMGRTYVLVATPRSAKLMTPVQGDVVKTVNTCNPHYSQKGIEVESQGCPFSIFLSQLKQEVGTTITDNTGMKGTFAYHLAYSMRPDAPPDVEQFPYLTNALREQLGLELRLTKGPVTVLVVDHVERPTPN